MENRLLEEIRGEKFKHLEEKLEKIGYNYKNVEGKYISFTEGKQLREGRSEPDYREKNHEKNRNRVKILSNYLESDKITIKQTEVLSDLVINSSGRYEPNITPQEEAELSRLEETVPDAPAFLFINNLRIIVMNISKKFRKYNKRTEIAIEYYISKKGEENAPYELARIIIKRMLRSIADGNMKRSLHNMYLVLLAFYPSLIKEFAEDVVDPNEFLELILSLLRMKAAEYGFGRRVDSIVYTKDKVQENMKHILPEIKDYDIKNPYPSDIKRYLLLRSYYNESEKVEFVNDFKKYFNREKNIICKDIPNNKECISKLLRVNPGHIDIRYFYDKVMNYIRSNQKLDIGSKLEFSVKKYLLYGTYQIVTDMDLFRFDSVIYKYRSNEQQMLVDNPPEVALLRLIGKRMLLFYHKKFTDRDYIIECLYFFFVILDERKEKVLGKDDPVYGNFKTFLRYVFFSGKIFYDIDMNNFMNDFISLKSKINQLFSETERGDLSSILSYLIYDFIYMTDNYLI